MPTHLERTQQIRHSITSSPLDDFSYHIFKYKILNNIITKQATHVNFEYSKNTSARFEGTRVLFNISVSFRWWKNSLCTFCRFVMKYERLIASENIEQTNEEDFRNVIRAQDQSKARRLLRDKVERLLWFGAFVAVVWLGDGSNNIWVVLLRDSETKRWWSCVHPAETLTDSTIYRSWFILALSSLAINFGILCYLIFYHDFHRRGSKWETRAKWALPVSCFFGAVTFIGFVMCCLCRKLNASPCILFAAFVWFYGRRMVGQLPL